MIRTTNERCPFCAHDFPTALNRAHPAITSTLLGATPNVSPEAEIRRSTLVRCPACSHTFESRNVRFFGVLTPRALRRGLILFFGAVIAFSVVKLVLRE